MDPASLPPIPPFIVQLTGPLYIGNIFNWALFGALSVQAYIYYLSFPNDRLIPTKAIVCFIVICEILQTILTTRDGFRAFGFGWGNMLILDQVGWQWFSIPLMTGAISAITQIFYAWRIWILSHRPYIPIVITLLALVQGGAGIWSGVNAKLIGIFSQIQTRNGTSTIVWLVGTAVCDVLIAVCMIYYLSKSRAGFRATNELLVKLIRITVETGLVTAAVAVVDLAMFLAFKDANYHIVPSITLSKLYSNSLLVLLNARVRILGGRNTGFLVTDGTLSWTQASTHQLSIPSERHQLSRVSYESTPARRFSIAVTRETSSDVRDSSIQKMSPV